MNSRARATARGSVLARSSSTTAMPEDERPEVRRGAVHALVLKLMVCRTVFKEILQNTT
ncbi:TPA: hypothetical protein HA318_03860 [Candidatus Micrarchaeota archaeon]|nr:hypothetical protein [Candidatus Micrarchaeota archaeon]